MKEKVNVSMHTCCGCISFKSPNFYSSFFLEIIKLNRMEILYERIGAMKLNMIDIASSILQLMAMLSTRRLSVF